MQIVAVAMGTILLAASWELRAWWVSPERKVAQFIAASRSGDVDRAPQFADASEIGRLGLGRGAVAALLEDASGVPGGARPGEVSYLPLNQRQAGFNRIAVFGLNDQYGRPIRSVDGSPARAFVYFYRGGGGWKLAFTHYIYSLLQARYGSDARARYVELCSAHGMAPMMFSPVSARWDRVEAQPSRITPGME